MDLYLEAFKKAPVLLLVIYDSHKTSTNKLKEPHYQRHDGSVSGVSLHVLLRVRAGPIELSVKTWL